MKEIRCPHCGWKLFLAEGRASIEIKCPRCKRIVEVKVEGQSEPHSK